MTSENVAVTTYKPDIILYHANCADGFGAAWACWMRWRDACQYTPASYGQEPPDVTGKHVLLVDFSYKRNVLREMGRKAASVIVLDHHKTAEADLSDWAIGDVAGIFWAGDDPLAAVRINDEYVGQPIAALFDMNKSGARLAWEFCHDSEAPDLVALIEDRDLWRFTDKRTKPFSLWLRARPFDFPEWEVVAQELNDADDGHRIMLEAVAMQAFSDQIVSDIASRARPMSIAGFDVPVVDCPPNFASEVCHALLVKNPDAPFAAAYSDNPNGKRGWSLRSQDHRQDVSEIAKRFGGGGHRNAAGFGLDLAAVTLDPDITRHQAEARATVGAGVPDDLRKASYYASDGPWEVDSEWNADGAYGGGPDHGTGYDDFLILDTQGRTLFGSENSTAKMIEEEYDEDGGTAWDQVAKRNAAFAVAAVNYVRSLLTAAPTRLALNEQEGG